MTTEILLKAGAARLQGEVGNHRWRWVDEMRELPLRGGRPGRHGGRALPVLSGRWNSSPPSYPGKFSRSRASFGFMMPFVTAAT